IPADEIQDRRDQVHAKQRKRHSERRGVVVKDSLHIAHRRFGRSNVKRLVQCVGEQYRHNDGAESKGCAVHLGEVYSTAVISVQLCEKDLEQTPIRLRTGVHFCSWCRLYECATAFALTSCFRPVNGISIGTRWRYSR